MNYKQFFCKKCTNNRIKLFIIYFLIFCLYFVLESKFIHNEWFGTDELDIMVGGKAISNGYKLYEDFLSQHMPFSYYISAIFDSLGATSVSLQRYCFYAFFSLFWTIILYRYKNVVSQKALFIFPLIHMSLITTYSMGTVVLSEHIAGIGCVIFFLEFLSFYENKCLSWDNYIFLSIAVVLTFGTTFIGAFSILIVGIAVFCVEVSWWYEDKKSIREKIKEWIHRYLPLFGICVLPWVILVVIYGIEGNLSNFIREAYSINRNIYPQYMLGYGESIVGVLIGITSVLFGWVPQILSLDDSNVTTLVYIIVLLVVVLYCAREYQKGKKIIAVFTLLFISSMGTRSVFNYHSTHMVETMALLCAIYLVECLEIERKRSLAVLSIFFLLVPYWSDMSGFLDLSINEETTVEATIIEQIVEPNEAVWQLDFENNTVMLSDRASISNVAAVPWMWKSEKNRVLSKIENKMPRVALFTENQEVWGYEMKDYAPEIIDFMEKNYEQYKDTSVYIRKDVYSELIKKIH